MSSKPAVILFHPRLTPEAGQIGFAPLSLLSVASPLVNSGYGVLVIDSNIGDGYGAADLRDRNIICVGITAMTGYQIKDGLRFAAHVRSVRPDLPIVWGGVHVSLLPEQSIRSEYVDVVVVGQGEHTIVDLVRCVEKKGDLSEVAGILYKKDGECVRTVRRDASDINKSPSLRYDLIDLTRYFDEAKRKQLRSSDAFLGGDKRFLYYCSSIGCPHRCGFCASSRIVGRRWSAIDAPRVVSDVKALVDRYGVNCLQFCDAEFFINRRRAMDIARGFIQNDIRLQWKAQVRADAFSTYDDDMLSLLKESGYTHVEIGVESGSQRMLDYINKDIKVEHVLASARKIQKYGMLASFCFVFGFPTETREDMRLSFQLAAKLKEMLPNCLLPVYFFDPYPEVPLFTDAIRQGLEPPRSLAEWSDIKPNMREPSPLAPWQTKRYMDQVHRVMIFYLPLAFPADIGLGTLTYVKSNMKKGRLKYIVRIAHWLSLIRVKKGCYGFPFEWMLFKAYCWLRSSFGKIR